MHETEARALTHVEYTCIIGPDFSRSSAGTSLAGEGQFTPPCRRCSNSPTHTTDACCFSAAVLLVVRLSEEVADFSCILTPCLRRNGISVNEEQQPVAFCASRKQNGPETRFRPTFSILWGRSRCVYTYMLRLVVVHASTQSCGKVGHGCSHASVVTSAKKSSIVPERHISNFICFDSYNNIAMSKCCHHVRPIKSPAASLEARAVLASKDS